VHSGISINSINQRTQLLAVRVGDKAINGSDDPCLAITVDLSLASTVDLSLASTVVPCLASTTVVPFLVVESARNQVSTVVPFLLSELSTVVPFLLSELSGFFWSKPWRGSKRHLRETMAKKGNVLIKYKDITNQFCYYKYSKNSKKSKIFST
jgi:hypothetical protein